MIFHLADGDKIPILDQMMFHTAVTYKVDRKVDMDKETEGSGRETEESLKMGIESTGSEALRAGGASRDELDCLR